MTGSRILYCHCAYAKIIPDRVKNEVLDRLTESGVRFEAVADLCELSARRDPSLKRLVAGEGELKIAACFPRSVKWLFAAAEAKLPDDVEVRNMRNETAEDTARALLGQPDGQAKPGNGAAAGGVVSSRVGSSRVDSSQAGSSRASTSRDEGSA